MPKNFTKKASTVESRNKRTWKITKKNLPADWCKEVSKRLSDKGFSYSAKQVSLIRLGAIRNPDAQIKVWTEIRDLEAEMLKKLSKLNSIKS